MTQFDTIFAALQATGVRYIEMKRAVGRLQDLLDVEKLEKIKHVLESEGDTSE